MQRVRLGRTGLTVSRVGFGGIPIQRLSDSEAVELVRQCLDLGISFIDTANGYTTSEERIGKAIAGRREGLVIATKTGAKDREGAWAHLRLSLQRLGIESIDLYQLHGVNTWEQFEKVTAPGGAMEAAQEARDQGLVKHIGITSHALSVARAAVASGLFETIQFPFSFMATEAAEELLPLVRERDLGFIAMKPLGGGLLERADLCFKYLLQFPDVVPDPGVERIEEMEEIVRIIEEGAPLTPMELAEMERIRQELGKSFCHRCDYCQPCRAGIAISNVMSVRSFLRRFPPERAFSGGFDASMAAAFDCLECGDCEARCPYNLPIREVIKANRELYRQAKQDYLSQQATP